MTRFFSSWRRTALQTTEKNKTEMWPAPKDPAMCTKTTMPHMTLSCLPLDVSLIVAFTARIFLKVYFSPLCALYLNILWMFSLENFCNGACTILSLVDEQWKGNTIQFQPKTKCIFVVLTISLFKWKFRNMFWLSLGEDPLKISPTES